MLIREEFLLIEPACRILRFIKRNSMVTIGLWASLGNMPTIMAVAENMTLQTRRKGGILNRLNVGRHIL